MKKPSLFFIFLAIFASFTYADSMNNTIIYIEDINTTINITDTVSFYYFNLTSQKIIFDNVQNSYSDIPVDMNISYPNLIFTDYQLMYYIDNCSNYYNATSYATSFYLQVIDTSKSLTNVNMTTNVLYDYDTYVTSSTSLNTFRYCIYPSWANLTGNIYLEYAYGDSLYTYSNENTILDNSTLYINLTVESGASEVTATVYDEIGTELEGVYIYPQKYDPITGNYISIGQFVTNFEGQIIIPLTLNTVRYKFLLYYPFDHLLETTNPTYIYATTISFYLQTGDDILEDFWKSESIASELTYDESTRTFTHTYLDVSGDVEQGCLTIFLVGNYDNQTYSRTCISGNTGTINLAVVNTTNAVYVAKSSVYIDGLEIPMDSLSVYFPSTEATDVIGFMGLLVDFILTIAVSFIFFFSIPLAIIMIPLPTVMLSTIGFIAVNPVIAWGIEVGALILAIIINKRS